MACKTCGENKAQAQPVASTVTRTNKAKAYIRSRAAVCALCPSNDSGVCLELKKITPDRPCEIKIGVEMCNAYCPEGKWGRHDPLLGEQRRRCRKCDGYSKTDAEFCGQCVNRMEVERRNLERGIGFNARMAHNGRTGDRLNQQQKDMWNAIKNNPARKVHRTSFTALYKETHFLTVNDLASDSVKLANALPPDVKAIVGIARSGITPANIIATMLHLPLLSIRQTKGDVVQVGNGWRMGGTEHIGVNGDAKVAIIDDTSMTGNSFKAIKPIADSHFKDYVTACVYVNPLSSGKPDIWVHELAWPHLLEWNLFNSVLSPNTAVDFDGILCHDCAGWQDDDGVNYLGFIKNALPKYLTRKTAIPLIVTARIEKYRKETEDWLQRHGVRFNQLIMHPARTLAERRRDDIAAFKAKHFEAWAKSHTARPRPSMFIESDDLQARRISELSGRLVVCPTTASCYGNAKK